VGAEAQQLERELGERVRVERAQVGGLGVQQHAARAKRRVARRASRQRKGRSVREQIAQAKPQRR
jgi:hypothetical protein